MESLIHQHRWAEVFKGEKGGKNYINAFIGALEPWKFRNEMMGMVKWANPDLLSDPGAFSQVLYDKVENYEPMFNFKFSNSASSSAKRGSSGPRDSKNSKRPKFEITCLKCMAKGHHLKECPEKPS